MLYELQDMVPLGIWKQHQLQTREKVPFALPVLATVKFMMAVDVILCEKHAIEWLWPRKTQIALLASAGQKARTCYDMGVPWNFC